MANAQFPEQVWNGYSANREREIDQENGTFSDRVNPNWQDWDQIREEVRAVQAYALSVAGPPPEVDSISSDETLDVSTTPRIILVDASTGAVEITLPDPSLQGATRITVTKTDSSANEVTVSPSAAETITGETSKTIAFQWSSMTLVSDGTNWVIV